MTNSKISEVKLNLNYANPYEKIKNTYLNTELYDTDMWDTAAKRGGTDLDTYANILQQQDKLPSLSELNKSDAFRFGDFDSKLYKLSLESNKSILNSEDTRKKRTENIYDNSGKVIKTNDLGEMTDYEYYTYELDKYGAELKYQNTLQEIEQAKQEMNWFEKAGSNTMALLSEFVVSLPNGVLKLADLLTNLTTAGWDSWRAIFGDLSWQDVDERFRKRFTDDQWLNSGVLELISDKSGDWFTNNVITRNYVNDALNDIDEMKMYSTTLMDVQGNYTNKFNETMSGVSRQLGEIVGGLALGAAAGAVSGAGAAVGSTTAKTVANTVSKTIFYGSMFQGRMEESLLKDPNWEHSTLELLTVNAVITASDAIIERLLPSTYVDTLIGWGAPKGLVKNPLVEMFIDAVKEGAEEVLQDFGAWTIGSLVDAAAGYDNFYSQDFDIMDYVWSFVGGAMMSVVTNSFGQVIKRVKNNEIFSDYFLTNKADLHTDEGFVKLTEDINNTNKIRDELISRKENDDAIFDENSETYFEKGSKEYNDYYDTEIAKLDGELNTLSNELNTYSIEFEHKLEQRKLTYESLDKKQKREFRYGILGLLNAMSDIADLEWRAKKGKRDAKVTTYFSKLLRSSYSMIANLYNTMGEERFNKMNKMLTELESRKANTDIELNAKITEMTKLTLKDIVDLVSNFKLSDTRIAENVTKAVNETSETLEKVNENKPEKTKKQKTNIALQAVWDGEVFKDKNGKPFPIKPDDSTEEGVTEAMVNTANALKNEKIDVVITDADNQVHSNSNTVIVPVNMAQDSPEAIKTSAAVTRAVMGISANLPKSIKDEITSKYTVYKRESLTKQLTFEDILRVMLFDADANFFNYMVNASSKFAVRVFVNLSKWINSELTKEIQGPLDGNLYKVLETMSSNMRPAIINYCLNMLDIDDNILENIYSVLDKETVEHIKQERYNYTLRNKVINSPDSLSDFEKQRLISRIKNMVLLDGDEKVGLTSSLFSDKEKDRMNAINNIDTYYDGIFNGPYNDKIYMKDNTLPAYTFNWWLQQHDLTITKLLNNQNEAISKLMSFGVESSGRFKAKLDMSSPSGITITYAGEQFGEFYKFKPSVNEQRNRYHRLASELGIRVSDTLKQLLSSKLNPYELDMLTVEDVLRRPDLYLSNETRSKIPGMLHRENVVKYINDYLLTEYNGSRFITLDRNGVPRLFIYDAMESFTTPEFMTDGVAKKYTSNEKPVKYDISKFIKPSLRVGPLEDIKVVVRKNGGTYYNEDTNTIYIDPTEIDAKHADAEFRYMLVHEFMHARDEFYGLNRGSLEILEIPKLLKNEIDKYVKLENDGEMDWVKNQKHPNAKYRAYLYLATGEMNAFGDELSIRSLPVISRTLPDGHVEMTMPWGTKILLAGDVILKINNTIINSDLLNFVENKQKILLKFLNGKFKEILPEKDYQEYHDKLEGKFPVIYGTDKPNKDYVPSTAVRGTINEINFRYRESDGAPVLNVFMNGKFDAVDIDLRDINQIQEELIDKGFPFEIYEIANMPIEKRVEFIRTMVEYAKIFESSGLRDYFYNSIAADVLSEHKKIIVENFKKHPEYKDITLKAFWMRFYSNILYDEFLEMNLPFVRYQYNPEIRNDGTFVSAASVADLRRMSSYFDKYTYVITGVIKPKDLIGAMVDAEAHEILIPTSYKNYSIHKVWINDDVPFGVNSESDKPFQGGLIDKYVIDRLEENKQTILFNMTNDQHIYELSNLMLDEDVDKPRTFVIVKEKDRPIVGMYEEDYNALDDSVKNELENATYKVSLVYNDNYFEYFLHVECTINAPRFSEIASVLLQLHSQISLLCLTSKDSIKNLAGEILFIDSTTKKNIETLSTFKIRSAYERDMTKNSLNNLLISEFNAVRMSLRDEIYNDAIILIDNYANEMFSVPESQMLKDLSYLLVNDYVFVTRVGDTISITGDITNISDITLNSSIMAFSGLNAEVDDFSGDMYTLSDGEVLTISEYNDRLNARKNYANTVNIYLNDEKITLQQLTKMLERKHIMNRIEDYIEPYEETKKLPSGELVTIKKERPARRLSRSRNVDIDSYNDAKKYVESIRKALKAKNNKSFGKTSENYGLPNEILLAMLKGKYDARSDIKYRTALAIMRAKESKDISLKRSASRKEKGEIYNYGYLSKTKAKGTVAEYYINNGRYKNYRGKFTAGEQRFLYNVDIDRIDIELAKRIREEQITQNGIYQYVRENYENMNEYTFNIIKESFFPNSTFESLNEVKDFVNALPVIYGIHGSMLENDALEFDTKPIREDIKTTQDYKNFVNEILTNVPELTKRYAELTALYPIDIDEGQAFLSALKYYDRTFYNAAYVANVAKYQSQLEHWKSRTDMDKYVRSLDFTITGATMEYSDKANELYEVVADTSNRFNLLSMSERRVKATELYRERQKFRVDSILENYEKAISERKERLQYWNNQKEKALQLLEKHKNDIDKVKTINEKFKVIEKKIAVLTEKIKTLSEDRDFELEIIEKEAEDFLEKLEYVWSDQKIDAYIVRMELTRGVTAESVNDLTEFEKLMEKYEGTKRTRELAKDSLNKYIANNIALLNKLTIKYMPDDLREYFTINKNGSVKFDSKKALYSNGVIIPVAEIDKLHEQFKEFFKKLRSILSLERRKKNIDEKLRKSENKVDKFERKNESLREKVNELKTSLNLANKTIRKLKAEKHTTAELNDSHQVIYKTKIINFSDTVKSDRPMPEILFKLLSTEFKYTSPSRIKGLSELSEDNEHTKITVKEFITENAKILAELTNDDVLSILDYFEHASFPIAGEEFKRISGVRNMILSYILMSDRRSDSSISLSDDTKQRITKTISASLEDAGRILGLWKGILNKINPWKIIAKQLRKIYDIELDDTDVELLDGYVEKGNLDAVEKQLAFIRDKIIKQKRDKQAEHKFRYFAEQLVRWTRASMLSGPSTIVRSKVSNVTINVLGKVTKGVGNKSGNVLNKLKNALSALMPNKISKSPEGYRKGQIDLSKKLDMQKDPKRKGYFIGNDATIGNYVNDFVDKSGIMDLIDDNISRYDTMNQRKSEIDGTTNSSDLTFILVSKLMKDISNELSWDVKLAKPIRLLAEKLGMKDAKNKIPDGFISFVFKMQSDSKWINKAFKKYFAVLIKEDGLETELTRVLKLAETTNLNPYSAMLANKKFVEALSQSYAYACYEYLHRGNFISDLTNHLRKTHPNIAIGLSLVEPFISGGFNWFVESLKYNPIGLAVAIGRFLTLDKRIENAIIQENNYKIGKGPKPAYNSRFIEFSIRNDLGKGLWGTVWFGLAMALAAVGFIVKDDDDDKYKLNFGGFYLDISNIFGSEPILIGASLVESAKKDGVNILDVLDSALETTFENFFLTNTIDSVRYNTGLIDTASEKLWNMVGSLVPNIWKAFVRVTKDSKMKYTKGVLGDLEYLAYSIIPFINWRKRIDPYTGDLEVQYSDSLIVRMLNEVGLIAGMKIKTNVPSDMELLLKSLNLDIGELNGEYDDIGKIDYSMLNVAYGKLNAESLADFVNDKEKYEVTDAKNPNKKVTLVFSKMTAKQKKQVIERIKRNNANYAKIYAWTMSGHKYYTSSSERKTLAKLGINENIYLKTNKLNGFIR